MFARTRLFVMMARSLGFSAKPNRAIRRAQASRRYRPGVDRLEQHVALSTYTVPSGATAAQVETVWNEATQTSPGGNTIVFAAPTGVIDMAGQPGLRTPYSVTIDGNGVALNWENTPGGFTLSGGASTISNLTVENADEDVSAGALEVSSGASVTLSHFAAIGCVDPIGVYQSNLTANGLTVDNSQGSFVVWVDGNGTNNFVLQNSTLCGNNTASGGLGTLLVYESNSATVCNVTLTDNNAGNASVVTIVPNGGIQQIFSNDLLAGNTGQSAIDVTDGNAVIAGAASPGPVIIKGDVIGGNTFTAAAVAVDGGNTTISQVMVAGNTDGAAAVVDNESLSADTLSVSGLLDIGNVDNATGGLGGGFADLSPLPATVTNSIFLGNIVTDGDGGGIYVGGTGTLTLTDDIVAFNVASGEGGGVYLGVGVVVNFKNTLVIFNGPDNVYAA